MNSAPGRFLMIRHGRTTANAGGILMGRTDAPLLPEARNQASQLGRTLDLDDTTVLYSSDQPCALHTAHLIGGPTLHPQPVQRSASDLAEDPHWPAVDTYYDVRPDDGESLHDVEARVFARLLHLHSTLKPETTLVVVGHSTCWRLVEAALRRRRHDPFDEPIPPPLTVLEHPRTALEILQDHI